MDTQVFVEKKKSNVELLMLVDDNKIDTFVHEKIVTMSSFANALLVKSSATEALKHIEQYHDNLTEVPSLLFLDINMPVMDGFDFLEAFNSFSPPIKEKCKIVMLSSSDLQQDKERAMAHSNVIGFLSKPLTVEKLNLVEKLMAQVR